MYIISQLISIKCPIRGFSTPTKWNLAEFGGLSRIWQNLIDIADIADIIVGTGPYTSPPSYIIAKYLKKNPLSPL